VTVLSLLFLFPLTQFNPPFHPNFDQTEKNLTSNFRQIKKEARHCIPKVFVQRLRSEGAASLQTPPIWIFYQQSGPEKLAQFVVQQAVLQVVVAWLTDKAALTGCL